MFNKADKHLNRGRRILYPLAWTHMLIEVKDKNEDILNYHLITKVSELCVLIKYEILILY